MILKACCVLSMLVHDIINWKGYLMYGTWVHVYEELVER
jgi:hypothetical protein